MWCEVVWLRNKRVRKRCVIRWMWLRKLKWFGHVEIEWGEVDKDVIYMSVVEWTRRRGIPNWRLKDWLKSILSAQVWACKVNWSDVVYRGQCALNGMNQNTWSSQGKPWKCMWAWLCIGACVFGPLQMTVRGWMWVNEAFLYVFLLLPRDCEKQRKQKNMHFDIQTLSLHELCPHWLLCINWQPVVYWGFWGQNILQPLEKGRFQGSPSYWVMR